VFVILARTSHALSAFHKYPLNAAHGPADGDGLALAEADGLWLAEPETLVEADGDRLADPETLTEADGDRLDDATITIPPNPSNPESPLNPGIYYS